jgi:hypothetical protein
LGFEKRLEYASNYIANSAKAPKDVKNKESMSSLFLMPGIWISLSQFLGAIPSGMTFDLKIISRAR